MRCGCFPAGHRMKGTTRERKWLLRLTITRHFGLTKTQDYQLCCLTRPVHSKPCNHQLCQTGAFESVTGYNNLTQVLVAGEASITGTALWLWKWRWQQRQLDCSVFEHIGGWWTVAGDHPRWLNGTQRTAAYLLWGKDNKMDAST